ncbi:MAG: CBS domain-containing protein [Thermomicrobium sp.]|nr:CBS domain-containing protein [Thermomicrobium sp.]MDW8058909.1 CBS domain-containing protein [Thermomicrobium sp.]
MADAIDTVYAREIMTSDVIAVKPDTSVDEVARLLIQHRITGVPVVDDEQRVIGIVSEFDLIAKRGRVAADVMSRDVLAVSEDTPAETIADLIVQQRVRRVPVLREGRLVGLVTRADLVRLFALTRWTCVQCGYFERGFHRPEVCEGCGGREFTLQREPPGM